MKAADGPILELLSFLQLFSPRDRRAQGGDADGTPSLRKLTALYVKQGLSTHDDNLGQIVAKFGRANERQCHHKHVFWLGRATLHRKVPADANMLAEERLSETKAACSPEVLDVIRS